MVSSLRAGIIMLTFIGDYIITQQAVIGNRKVCPENLWGEAGIA
jgi:hypothetical protein